MVPLVRIRICVCCADAVDDILVVPRIRRVNIYLLLDLTTSTVAPLVLIANDVHLLNLRQIIALQYRILYLLSENIINAVTLTVEGMVDVVSLVISHNALNWYVLHFISLHLHLHPLVLRILIQNQRRNRRNGLVVTSLDVW